MNALHKDASLVFSATSAEISETPTHTFQQRQKKKRQSEWKEMETWKDKNTVKAFIEPVISLCSSTSPCYCAPIFRSQSLAGLYGAQGRVSSNHIRLYDPNTEPLRKSEWNQQGQVYEDGPCNIYEADSVIPAFDWIWRDMNLTARVWLADTEEPCYKEIGCVSKPCELLN